jgi:hypothetical protein
MMPDDQPGVRAEEGELLEQEDDADEQNGESDEVLELLSGCAPSSRPIRRVPSRPSEVWMPRSSSITLLAWKGQTYCLPAGLAGGCLQYARPRLRVACAIFRTGRWIFPPRPLSTCKTAPAKPQSSAGIRLAHRPALLRVGCEATDPKRRRRRAED